MSREVEAQVLDEVVARYREERAKRVAAARASTTLTGSLARYLEDPLGPPRPRDPVHASYDVLVIGGGLSGLCTAVELKKVDNPRVAIVDSAGDFGGVWYWNRYPGAMCDIESYIYMPYLEELDYVPTTKYAYADEIFAHLQNVAKHYDLYEHALFHTTVEAACWDEADRCWVVRTNRGDELRATYLMLGNGALTTPQIPSVPGVETFEGRLFHTSRWDFDYTGGGNRGGMDKLHDQTVAVVGTGATALQCVPELAKAAQRLYVFQRTPSTVGVRANRSTDSEWAKSLEPGWQRQRQLNYGRVVEGLPVDEDLVNDGWTWTAQMLRDGIEPDMSPKQVSRQKSLNDVGLMSLLRDRVSEVVEDAVTAEALKPYYPYPCKRPGFHDEFLQSFNRSNVSLVDTAGRGIERITPQGLVSGDTEYDVDCIIFATGFDGTATAPRTSFDVFGAGGQTLADSWRDGVSTLHGVVSGGFPNLFLVPFPHMGQGAHPNNYTHLALEVGQAVARVVSRLRDLGATKFEVDTEAEAAWVEIILRFNPDNPEFLAQCTPGRGNNEGRFDLVPPQNTNYGRGGLAYFEILERWSSDASLPGLVVSRDQSAASGTHKEMT